MQYKVKNRQSLLDIALLTCGSVDAVFTLATRNGLSVTDDVAPGTIIEYTFDDVTQDKVVELLAAAGAEPATAITEAERHSVPYGGIGYMGIQIDFIVS